MTRMPWSFNEDRRLIELARSSTSLKRRPSSLGVRP